MIQVFFFFAVIACLTLSYAYRKGFFHLKIIRPALPMTIWHLFFPFFIYIGSTLIAAPIIANNLRRLTSLAPSQWLSLTQFFSSILTLVLLLIYSLRDQTLIKLIWKDPLSTASWLKDLGIGVLTWCIAFPLVAAVGELLDFIIYGLFNFEQYDQVAIKYLKSSLNSPSSLFLALFTIILSAPVIEEFLFRGCLQNWLKKKLGFKAAILLASFFFAVFHLSFSQGAGNISLFISLLVFACFLGFIYEKQRSLFAPVGLHMTFNLISAFRLIFGPDI